MEEYNFLIPRREERKQAIKEGKNPDPEPSVLSEQDAQKKKQATELLNKVKKQNSGFSSFDKHVDQIEIRASAEDKETIRDAVSLVQEELKELGLEKNFSITEDEVHFFNRLSHNRGGGYSVPTDQIMILKQEKLNFAEKIKVVLTATIFKYKEKTSLAYINSLIHEITHKVSYHKYIIEKNEVTYYRCGYHFMGKDKYDKHGTNGTDYFLGFDEAVTMKNELDIISKKFGKNFVTKNLFHFFLKKNAGHKLFLDTVEQIVKHIAKTKKISKEDVWRDIKRGQITGEMMHLRIIEKIYGKGSLKKLAYMGWKKISASESPNTQLTYEFFKHPPK